MTLLMIRPVRFGYNAQTAVNNAFQQKGVQHQVQAKALMEFDYFVDTLRKHDIDVMVVQDTESPHTPDSIFPNNWISFHEDGTLVLYPMFAENRRLERKQSVFEALDRRFIIREKIDYTHHETSGRFLEGTGSFLLDRENRVAYACRSPRTDEALFTMFCAQMGYKPIVFHAFDTTGIPVYHTNVMLCIADGFVVINLVSIPDDERASVVAMLESTGKKIISITHNQMQQFAGNMLQVENKYGKRYLVLSSQAHRALLSEQVKQLEGFGPLIHVPLDTIEKNGGGSARCMMAEVFLPPKQAVDNDNHL